MRATMTAITLLLLAACSGGVSDEPRSEGNAVALRNLVETEVAAPAKAGYTLQGDLIPTPSDPRSRYFLLRQRRAIGGNIVAILRQERGDRIAYARTETDCAQRRFHVLGVGGSRGDAEVDRTMDGPLRPIAGLPLREELARYVCERAGTPLA
jgi:hypothetical protein